ncbi:hypothetical protein ACVWY3_002412 [Bradyrhizobium sp. USDA 4486]
MSKIVADFKALKISEQHEVFPQTSSLYFSTGTRSAM